MGNNSLGTRSEVPLQAFLQGRPVEWAEVIASRASLRVLPLALGLLAAGDYDAATFDKHCMLLFRANFVAWARSRYRDVSFAASSVSAAQAAFAQNELANELYDYCLSAAAYAVTPHEQVYAAGMAAFNADLAADYIAPLRAGEEYPSGGKEIFSAIEDDCKILINQSMQGLHDQPLWPLELRSYHETGGNLPKWAMRPLVNFLRSEHVQKRHWYVLLEWYMAILPSNKNFTVGTYFSNKASIFLGLQDEDFWGGSPDFVLRTIANIAVSIDGEDEEKLLDKVSEAIPQQGPAAFRFSAADGPIDAVPLPPETQQREFARSTLSEAREKAHELLERLKSTNASQRVKRSVARLAAALPDEFDTLNPALLRSKSRSLEADAYAFAAAGAEAELFPEAVSELLDLTATIKDLQGCFSTIAEIERQAAEISVAGREADAEEALARIGDSAQELATDHPELVTQSAADAVNSLKADIADAPNAKIKARLIADASLTQSNFLAAAYSKVLSPTGREMIRVSGKMYHAAVDGTADGVRYVAAKGPLLALAYYLGGPLLAMAAIFANLKPLKDAQLAIEQQSKREALEKPDPDSDGSAHPVE